MTYQVYLFSGSDCTSHVTPLPWILRTKGPKINVVMNRNRLTIKPLIDKIIKYKSLLVTRFIVLDFVIVFICLALSIRCSVCAAADPLIQLCCLLSLTLFPLHWCFVIIVVL